MASTPAQRFVCPRCRTSFGEHSRYCRECGADMTRASALEAAVKSPTGQTEAFAEDRRVSDSNQAWLGKVVDGRYRVLEVIGRGGMGVVYRVEHLRMGKVAAMKVLHRDLAEDADVVQRFEREAAAVSRLHHPHTVQVFDFGTAQGALYLIMEYVRGQDLGRIVDRDGPMPWARAAPLFAQICGSLQESHEYGIVHRDLKPENVLITRSTAGRDYAKVLDFGLAKLDQRNAAPKRETERSQIVGTPYFMSPEQIRGEEVDARSDIYSFGALMFQVLTGQHLYTGSTAVGVLTKHLTAEPDAPSMRTPRMGIPPAVDHLVRKALARDPADRWQSATQLGEAIEETYRETVSETTGPKVSRSLGGGALVFETHEDAGSDVRLRRSDIDAYEASIRRRRVLVWLTLLLFTLAAAGAVVWFFLRPPGVLRAEVEPNNEPSAANRIAAGTPITGYLGKRIATNEGDKDVYRSDGGRRVISVTVSGLPNIDIELGVGNVTVDEGRVGDGEVLHRRSVDGVVLVTVGQKLERGKLPVENVSDTYELKVIEERMDAGEIEPNNMDADATPLVPTYELTGYLDTKTDVDLLRWTGESGTYIVVVRGEGLQWQLSDGKARTPGEATLELKKGEIVRIERSPTHAKPATWTIVVVGNGRAK